MICASPGRKPGEEKEVKTMLNSMLNHYMTNLSSVMAEDVNAPELRNPKLSGMQKESWLRRLLQKVSL